MEVKAVYVQKKKKMSRNEKLIETRQTVFLGAITTALFVTVGVTRANEINERACTEATDSCPNEHVKFYLYTKYVRVSFVSILFVLWCTRVDDNIRRETKNDPVQLTEDSIRTRVPFARTSDLKILVHGLRGSRDDEFNTVLRKGERSPRVQYNRALYAFTIGGY